MIGDDGDGKVVVPAWGFVNWRSLRWREVHGPLGSTSAERCIALHDSMTPCPACDWWLKTLIVVVVTICPLLPSAPIIPSYGDPTHAQVTRAEDWIADYDDEAREKS